MSTAFGLEADIGNSSWAPGPASVHLYHGILAHGFHYPSGTSQGLIVPSIEPPRVANMTHYKARAEGMIFNLDCEVLPHKIKKPASYHPEIGAPTVAVEVPDCKRAHLQHFVTDMDTSQVLQVNETTHYVGYFDWHSCKNGAVGFDTAVDQRGHVIAGDISEDLRLLLAVGELQLSSGLANPPNTSAFKVVTALCKPNYLIDLFDIGPTMPSNGSAHAVHVTDGLTKPRRLDSLSDTALGKAVWTAMTESKRSTSGLGFFELMKLKGNHSSLEPLLDPGVLLKTASAVFNGVAAQLMHGLVLPPADQNLTGTITVTQYRLKVTKESTILMFVSFSILASISVATIYLRPKSYLPAAPDSIASIATVLSHTQSSNALAFLKTLPTAQEKACAARRNKFLQGAHISGFELLTTTIARKLGDKPVPKRQEQLQNEHDTPISRSWWNPTASTHWFFTIVTLLPIAVILVLEVLQRKSNNNNGLFFLGPYTTTLFTSMLPAAISLLIASFYSSLLFAAILSMPFITLRRGKATAAHSLHLKFFGGHLSLVAYNSCRNRHYALLTAILASFISAFLTVIGSGLYKISVSSVSQPITLSSKDVINLDAVAHYNQSWAYQVTSLIEFRGLNYTEWTHKDLIFNRLEQVDLSSQDLNSQSWITVEIPTIRPKLNCSGVEVDRKITVVQNTSGYVRFRTNMTFPWADWCEPMLSGNDPQTLDWSSPVYSVPQFAFTLGWAQVENPYEWIKEYSYNIDMDIGMVLCYLNYEAVKTTVHLTGPDLNLEPSKPPQPDESSAFLLKNKKGSARFELMLDEEYLNGISSATVRPPITAVDDLENQVPDIGFIHTLLYGKNQSSAEELGGAENTGALYKASNRLFSTYMAQIVSREMRIQHDGNNLSAFDAYNGTLTTPGSQRLQQDNDSKIVLQVMLGIMVACAVITRFLLPMGDVLPHNPCSIAGIASLLVGGSLVTSHSDHRSEDHGCHSSEALSRSFDERRYSLKWWKITDDRFIYRIDVDKDDGFDEDRASTGEVTETQMSN
ncbi:hypothetical protein HJFPF1_07655 [Paramyrothecium foliicola]|nr:hypothetical protein HJFPF1_07655 [Paramyrothecium foliicola]